MLATERKRAILLELSNAHSRYRFNETVHAIEDCLIGDPALRIPETFHLAIVVDDDFNVAVVGGDERSLAIERTLRGKLCKEDGGHEGV